MSVDIRLPNISASTDKGKIEQIQSYLYQLAEQLKFALNTIENSSATVLQSSSANTPANQEKEAQSTFNSIKSLIISSAEIVEQYSEEVNRRLSGEYVAQSDFGTYKETTSNTISETSKSIENVYTSLQEIISDIEGLENSSIEVKAHLRTGLLEYNGEGVPIYGLEVGQKNEVNGVETFNKYARFTSDRLSFYDKNDIEVAYISDYKLHITNATITGTLTLGRFEFDSSDGLAIKWV